MKKRKAYFIDADYIVHKGETYVRLLLKGKRMFRLYYAYEPYFYADVPENRRMDLEKIQVRRKNGELARVTRSEIDERFINGERKKFLKVFCEQPSDVPLLKGAIPFPCYEYSIPFARRFIIDFNLIPLSLLQYEREKRRIKKFTVETASPPQLTALAIDIETYNPLGAPREKKDPIVMISYKSERTGGVITYKKIEKKFVETMRDEKEMLMRFGELVRQEDPDIIFGYNSSNFDLPYLKTRADQHNFNLALGKTRKKMRKITKGLVSGMKIDGRIHIDLYPAARFFGFIGMIKAQQFTLEKIYAEVTGKKKLMVKRLEIWKVWDTGELDELAEYSHMDAQATYELGMHFLPLHMELSALTKIPLFEIVVSTSGQMVEGILMNAAAKRKEIIPSKPSAGVVQERIAAPIEGAYVKLPEPGIYENIAVLDFRGLYPSIIASYNIDPVSLALGKRATDSDCFIAPTGAKFVKEPRGLIPSVIDWLIEYRIAIKKELKKVEKDSEKYKELHARSIAIKIVTNTVYGYSAFPRSRWYSREGGEATTAWGRKHIMDTIAAAEKNGFSVLYSDTDSLFIIYKHKEDVLRFMNEINDSLPEQMELELEGFYPRGVFVSKKGKETKGAKKKYALLGEDGKIKIRGFELVRRDWSEIAKETQRAVLNTILKEGSKEKAVAIVRRAIERLQSGKVPIAELAIETQLNKSKEDYEVTSPALSAAEKGVKRGIPAEKGSVISFVITKKGKTISEKAELAEFAQDYDIDYYIHNQILPAVMKILKELGYSEEDLKLGGKQKGLMDF